MQYRQSYKELNMESIAGKQHFIAFSFKCIQGSA